MNMSSHPTFCIASTSGRAASAAAPCRLQWRQQLRQRQRGTAQRVCAEVGPGLAALNQLVKHEQGEAFCPFACSFQHTAVSATLELLQKLAAYMRILPLPACAAHGCAPACLQVEVPARFPASDWRHKAKPIREGSNYPAGKNCSHCGLW